MKSSPSQNGIKLSDLSLRVLKVLEEKGISGYRLEKEKTGITQSQISHIKSGRNQPSKDVIDNLIGYFTDINRIWLLTGEGDMIKAPRQIHPHREVDTVDHIKVPDPENDEGFNDVVVENNFGNKFVKLENGQYLMYMPLFEWDVAASLLDNDGDTRHPDYDNVEQHVAIVSAPMRGKYSAFRVKGVSMEGTTPQRYIPDGAIVWGRELQRSHWRDQLYLNKRKLWIVGSTEFGRPTLKEITEHHVETATIVVDSWNPSAEFAHNVPISLNTVKMLYYVIRIETEV